MPWTDPRTWVDGETPTGAQFNTQIRDNLKYLKETPAFDGDIEVTGDVTVTTDLHVGNDADVGSDLTVQGKLTVNGETQLGDTPADTVRIKGLIEEAPLKTYSETRVLPVIVGGALALDVALGTYFRIALNANCVISVANVPAAGRVVGLTLIFTADGTLRTITWPTGTVWAIGVPPTMTSTSGKRDIVTLITDDGGVTWFGIVVGQSY